jgi:hypothetical protein
MCQGVECLWQKKIKKNCAGENISGAKQVKSLVPRRFTVECGVAFVLPALPLRAVAS